MSPVLKHFMPNEFSCQCGCGGGFSDMDERLLLLLDAARTAADVPFRISSAYRCDRHNEAVGGVEESAHTSGNAVDIIARSGYEKWRIVQALMDVGLNRIGISKSFIHVDNDPSKPSPVIWTY